MEEPKEKDPTGIAKYYLAMGQEILKAGKIQVHENFKGHLLKVEERLDKKDLTSKV